MAESDRWRWHAYDYGWRRVVFDDQTGTSPIDEHRQWYDAHLVGSAEAYWRRRLRIRKPAAGPQGPRTPEEIAHIERSAEIARTSIEAFVKRSKRAFSPKRDLDPVKRVRDELGVWVAEREEAAE